MQSASTPIGPVEKIIRQKLEEAFRPVIHVEVINESYMHNVPKGSETHFKVIVVSDQFESKNLVSRHRAVNDTLCKELASGVHALSIVAKTGIQWEAMNEKNIDPSPKCRGGFGK